MRTPLWIAVAVTLVGLSSTAEAQRRVQYDTLTEMTPAAVSCGFCAGEKFGMVFRELSGGRGLRADEFPLVLKSLEIVIGRAVVTGSLFGGGYTCQGSTAEGTVEMPVAVYAGQTPPSGSIRSMPDGAWPGETEVWSDPSVPLQVSVEMTAGSNQYHIMVNTVDLPDGGVRVAAPNTYLRVVVGEIPSATDTSSSCAELSLPEPAAMGVRDDDGRIADNVGFIRSVGGIGSGWYWSEELTDESGATLNGDWGVRINVLPDPGGAADAGVTGTDAGSGVDGGSAGSDAGTSPSDAGAPDAGPAARDAGGSTSADGGPTSSMDGGSSSTSCSGDVDCGGGERCVEGMCQRVACTAASDCAGGMTCVEGMCRNLCAADSECLGGQVCDSEAGHCVPVGSLDDGGCGCRAAGVSSSPLGVGGVGLWLLAGGLAWLYRRRRRG